MCSEAICDVVGSSGNPRGWHRTVQGLALRRGVLEQFAHRNAEWVLGLPAR
jgi:hypothetical protein